MSVRRVAAGRLGPAGAALTVHSAFGFATLHDQLHKLERELTEWRTVNGVAVQRPREGVSMAAWNHLRNVRALAVQLAEQIDPQAVTLRAVVDDVAPMLSSDRDQREET